MYVVTLLTVVLVITQVTVTEAGVTVRGLAACCVMVSVTAIVLSGAEVPVSDRVIFPFKGL